MRSLVNPWRSKPTGVQAVSVGSALGGGLRKWQHVSGDGGAAADEGMRPNAHEVMHRTQRPYRCPVSYSDVATQRSRAVDDVAANLAIVRDMGIGHDQVMAADPGASSAFHRAAGDGDKFANGVVVTDLQPRSAHRHS